MIRYRKLGYIALNVSNLEKSTDFYQNIVGLQLVDKIDHVASFLRCSRDHHNIVLYQENDLEPGLKRIGIEVEDREMLEFAFDHLQANGLEPYIVDEEERKFLAQGKTIRFYEPTSCITFELYSDITQMPLEFKPTLAEIQRLGHFVVRVPEWEKTLDVFMKKLNFKVSDFVGENMAFMRMFPNPYHHSVGVAKYDKHQFHHVNFMVSNIDDVGRARNRLMDNDVPIVYGPGRHSPSGSIFLYFLDPDGLTVEYSFGMEEFPEEGSRKPKLLQRSPLTLDLWGGKPHKDYASKGLIEGTVKKPLKV